MSLPIWTPDALSSEARPSRNKIWRLVEAQHRVATLKLVDTLDEQALLEDILETSKPALPVACQGLNYLLATPFRYGAPYPHGSRFRRAGRTEGVYYGSEELTTALAEMAFYRILFYADSPDTPLPVNAAEYTAFAAAIGASAQLDLTLPPLDRDADHWCHLTDYSACQELADQARIAGIDTIRYQSVRAPGGGTNVAVLSCQVFARPEPVERQTWRIRWSDLGVQAICDFPAARHGFSREDFAADPRL